MVHFDDKFRYVFVHAYPEYALFLTFMFFIQTLLTTITLIQAGGISGEIEVFARVE